MGNNSDLKDARTITGERKWNFSSEIEDGSYWGFTAMGKNSDLKIRDPVVTGERKDSESSLDDSTGRHWGFTSITVDTTNSSPNGNWTLTVNFRRYNDVSDIYMTKACVLNNDQFTY
jgi:hypothetical protein